jgi:hypothetical protein
MPGRPVAMSSLVDGWMDLTDNSLVGNYRTGV